MRKDENPSKESLQDTHRIASTSSEEASTSSLVPNLVVDTWGSEVLQALVSLGQDIVALLPSFIVQAHMHLPHITVHVQSDHDQDNKVLVLIDHAQNIHQVGHQGWKRE